MFNDERVQALQSATLKNILKLFWNLYMKKVRSQNLLDVDIFW